MKRTSFPESDSQIGGARIAATRATGTGGTGGGLGSGSLTLKPPTVSDKRKKFGLRAGSGTNENSKGL